MSKKIYYAGSTSKCPPRGTVSGIGLVDERCPDRIDIHFIGVRGGEYLTSMTIDDAVNLILKLEDEVTRVAAKDGYTHTAFVRLCEHRKAVR